MSSESAPRNSSPSSRPQGAESVTFVLVEERGPAAVRALAEAVVAKPTHPRRRAGSVTVADADPSEATPAGHALVVGGSGMLEGFCRALAADGWLVTVVGRDRSKLARASAGAPHLHPLSVDYEELAGFTAALAAAAAARGPIVLAVCWIRSWAPESLRAAAAAGAPGGRLV